MVVLCLMSAVFVASTFLLFIGMLPTLVSFYVDRTKQKSRVVTVGALNLAGCTPFLYELWGAGHTLDYSIYLITSPQTIVVVYAAAGVGYLLDWALSGIVSSILHQKGVTRHKQIQKRKKDLIERWGPEVTGEYPLDQDGFPLHPIEDLPSDTLS